MNTTEATTQDTAAVVDPLVYVRERLAATKAKEWMRFATDAGLSLRTLQNINKGNGAQYRNVMALFEVMKKAEAAPAE